MPDTLDTLQRIAEPMREPIQRFAGRVEETFGPNLKGLTLFGSIVSGPFDPAKHTARSCVVLDSVDLAALRRLADEGTRMGKAAIAAPLVMTPAYIQSSLDTFPIELLNIKLCHVTLLGEDLFEDLEFEDGHIRLQCERELKTILIGLRQGLLASAGREAFLGAVEVDATDALMRTLRGLLWLEGVRTPKPPADVLAEAEKLGERKLPGIRGALDPTASHDWHNFEQLYADVETLGKVADAW